LIGFFRAGYSGIPYGRIGRIHYGTQSGVGYPLGILWYPKVTHLRCLGYPRRRVVVG